MDVPYNLKRIRPKFIIKTDDILSIGTGIIIYVVSSNNYTVDPIHLAIDKKVGGVIDQLLYSRTHRLLYVDGIIRTKVSDRLSYVGVIMGSVKGDLFVFSPNKTLSSIRHLYKVYLSIKKKSMREKSKGPKPYTIYVHNKFTNLFFAKDREEKQSLENLKLTLFNYFYPDIFFVEDNRVISPIIKRLDDRKAYLLA